MSFDYPPVRRDESVKDVYHGVEVCVVIDGFPYEHVLFHQVSDPYRWLEDPDSEETKEFVKRQNDLTRPYLDKCIYKDKIKSTMTELWNYPKCSHPSRYNRN